MSYTKKESIDKNQYKITFTIEKEAFDKAEMAAYKKNVAKMNIPGFRKGKAPKAIVEKMYGKGVFYEAFDFCAKRCDQLRIDTHEDNITMQRAVENCGFVRCGVIYTWDGSPRIAYHYDASKTDKTAQNG